VGHLAQITKIPAWSLAHFPISCGPVYRFSDSYLEKDRAGTGAYYPLREYASRRETNEQSQVIQITSMATGTHDSILYQ